jgi:TPR repeat protein
MAPLVIGGIAFPSTVVSPAMETASEYSDSYGRGSLLAKAEAGDAAAQYKLADLFCCRAGGPLDRISVYDNEKATDWYCRAAVQGYAPAQIRLAQIYSGHPLHGFHTIQYLSAFLADPPTELTTALLWANVAAEHGDDFAVEWRDHIKALATPEQRAQAAAQLADWRSAPCRWLDVFPAANAAGKAVPG